MAAVILPGVQKFPLELFLAVVGLVLMLGLYLLDKSGKSSPFVNTGLLIFIAGILIFSALRILWVSSLAAWQVWRMAFVVCAVLFGVSAFGIWTWPKPQPVSLADHIDERLTALKDEIRKLRDDFIKSPSVDDAAKVSVLNDKISELSKEKDTFTKREKEILNEQTLSISSLEEARKQYLEKTDREKQQQELGQRQAEIERQNAEKKAQQEHELQEKEFAEQYIPIVDYAITTLYSRLRDISRESSDAISTDFPGDRPSLYGSTMLKEGKIVDGEHIIRVGSNKEWEFHLTITGTPHPRMRGLRRYLDFRIQAGMASVNITNPRPMTRPPFLRITFSIDNKPQSNEDCSFSEYQKPIERAIRQLIQNPYNESPLRPKP